MIEEVGFASDDGARIAQLNDSHGMPDYHSPRSYWHPISTPGGVTVTETSPDDHPWHWGLSLGIANIRVDAFGRTCNLWGGPTFALPEGYRDAGDNGRQAELSRVVAEGDTVDEEFEWRLADGRPFVREHRVSRVQHEAGTPEVSLRVRSEWTNLTAAEVVFGSPTTAGRPDAGYGGWFLRGAGALRGGRVTIDDRELSQEQARGTSGSRLVLRTPTVRLEMADHPDNPVAPTPWFVRTDPVVMVCAAPFFHEEFVLPGGEAVTWQWGLTVADA